MLLRYIILFGITLYCTVICCGTHIMFLYRTVLCQVVLYKIMFTIWCCIYTVLYDIALHRIALYCTVLCCLLLCWFSLYCIVLYCIVLHLVMLCCVRPYDIVLSVLYDTIAADGMLYYTLLYSTLLYSTIQYYTVLYLLTCTKQYNTIVH